MVIKKTVFTTLWVVLLCAAFVQPNHFSPWVSFHSELIAFVAFAVLFALGLAEQTNATALEVQGAGALITIFLGIIFAQAYAGIISYCGDTLVFVLYVVAMFFAIVLGRLLASSSKVHQLAWGITLAGVMSVLVAMLQSIHPTEQFTLVNPMPGWRRPGANLAQPNHLGTLLLWALVSVMYLHAVKKVSKPLVWLFAAVLFVGIAMTESRTALLGVFVIAAWSGVRYFKGSSTRRFAMSFGFVCLGVTLFALWPQFIVNLQESNWSEGRGTINTQPGERLVVWPQLIAAVMERPWFGWGMRGVSAAHNAVLDRYAQGAPFTYAHNVVIDLAIGFGIPIAILLLGFAFSWFVRRINRSRTAADWYAVALLLPFLLHSMLEFPFAYAYFLLPACFAVGMLDAERFGGSLLHLPRKVAIATVAMWAFLGAIAVRDYMLAEEDFRVARFEALKIGQTPSSYEQPRLFLLSQLEAMNLAIRFVPRAKMTAAEIESLREAALRFPWTATQNRYALALALNGMLPEAQRQLKVMRAMHGEKTYAGIKLAWQELGNTKYPQLLSFSMP